MLKLRWVAVFLLVAVGACTSSPGAQPTAPAPSTSLTPAALPALRLPYLGLSGGGEFGEPMTTLTAVAKLPATPRSAPAFVVTGTITAAQVARLAAAVGATGTVTPQGGVDSQAWVDKSPTTWLSVEPSGCLGRWLFRQIPPSPLCAPEWADAWCVSGTAVPAAAIPTSTAEAIARQTVADAGMGLGAAQVTDSIDDGGMLVVFTPVYGGLAVTGLTAAVDVGDDGSVRRASGFLGTPVPAGNYPLVTATAAVARLDAGTALPTLNAGNDTSVCDLLPGEGCGSPPEALSVTQVHSVRLVLAPAVPGSGPAVLEPAFAFDASSEVVPAAVGAALTPEGLEGEPSPGPMAIGFSLPSGPQPAPAEGNGLGPGGECTGRETVPPCGPGMVIGRYYSYTVPSRCGGKLVADGRLWTPGLPLGIGIAQQRFWISIGSAGGGVFGPGGAVGFTAAAGSSSSCSS